MAGGLISSVQMPGSRSEFSGRTEKPPGSFPCGLLYIFIDCMCNKKYPYSLSGERK